jgi:hypothetical protein
MNHQPVVTDAWILAKTMEPAPHLLSGEELAQLSHQPIRRPLALRRNEWIHRLAMEHSFT